MNQTTITQQTNVSWSGLSRWGEEAARRFGKHLALPTVDLLTETRRYLNSDTRILDIGAGIRKPFSTVVPAGQHYSSMDVDPEGDFTYRTFSDVPADATFDLIVMNQLLEHLTIGQAYQLLADARPHLTARGHVVATVPNPAHPVRHWGDPTHVTPWPADGLYGLFRSSGYEVVELARYGKKPLEANRLRRFIVKVIADQFRIDWADSIFLAARCDGNPSVGERQL